MAPVRFPIMSSRQLEKAIDECEDLSLKVALGKLVQDFQVDRRVSRDTVLNRRLPYMLHPRKCSQRSMYVIGGYRREAGGRWSDSRSLSHVEVFNTFSAQWTSLPPLSNARSGHGAATLNGQIFVAGGENTDSMILDSMECFDPGRNSWIHVANLTLPRCAHSLCAVDNQLYAIGGWVGSEIGDTIERYSAEDNTWEITCNVNTLRYAMGSIVHEGEMPIS